MRKTTIIHKALLFAVLAVCLVAGYLLLNNVQSSSEESGIKQATTGWYRVQNGEKAEVTLPSTVACTNGVTELRLDTLPSNGTGQILTTHAAKYALEVYVGDRLIYRYDDHGQNRNDTVLANEVCFVPLPDDLNGESLRVIYHAPGQTEISVPAIQVGTWEATILCICRQNAYTLAITLTLLILGLLSFVFAFVVQYRGERSLKLMDVGCFLLLCGFWCLTDSALIQMLFSYDRWITYLNFYAFMFMPIPMLYYVRNTQKMRRYRAFSAFFVMYYLNIGIQTLLLCMGKYTLFQMLWVTHCFFIAGIILCLWLLVKEYRRTHSADVRACLWAFAAVAALGAVSIGLYSFAEYRAYQALFQTGILLFVLILLSVIAEELVNNLRYRTEVEVYRQMAEEDKLTNLQNRRAFDLRIQKIEQNIESKGDVALVFMDVNGLKIANDLYGHSAGDQLVIAAARCAESAFGTYGDCYRIGGDEFCAILPNPPFDEEELLARLHRQVELCNENPATGHPISLACGCSFLKTADGTMQTVSNWKAEADHKMYEDKKIAHEKLHLCEDQTIPRGERPL